MLKRPTYTGVENIVSGFETLNPDAKLHYSIWHSLDDIAFQCVESDPVIQKEMLQNYLEALEKSGNTELMYLKCHPSEIVGYISKKTPVVSNTPIQICESQDLKILSGENISTRPTGMSYEAWEMMKSLKELPATLEDKINAALDAKLNERFPDEEEEEETDQVTKYIGIIKGVTSDPQIMGIIGQLMNFFKPGPVPAAHRIGMVEQTQPLMDQQPVTEKQPIEFDENLMNDSLNRLRFHCNIGTDLALLANLAETNPAYFEQLLKMLRP